MTIRHEVNCNRRKRFLVQDFDVKKLCVLKRWCCWGNSIIQLCGRFTKWQGMSLCILPSTHLIVKVKYMKVSWGDIWLTKMVSSKTFYQSCLSYFFFFQMLKVRIMHSNHRGVSNRNFFCGGGGIVAVGPECFSVWYD